MSKSTLAAPMSLRACSRPTIFPHAGTPVHLTRWVQNERFGARRPEVKLSVVGRVSESPAQGSSYFTVVPFTGTYDLPWTGNGESWSWGEDHVTFQVGQFSPVAYWPEIDGEDFISLCTVEVIDEPALQETVEVRSVAVRRAYGDIVAALADAQKLVLADAHPTEVLRQVDAAARICDQANLAMELRVALRTLQWILHKAVTLNGSGYADEFRRSYLYTRGLIAETVTQS